MSRISDIAWTIGILSVIVTLIAVPAYEWQSTWAENGHVNWIGTKQFSSDGWGTWKIPFSVVTFSHGTFNFTQSTFEGTPSVSVLSPRFGCQSSNAVTMNVTALVGVYRTNYGCVELVNDP